MKLGILASITNAYAYSVEVQDDALRSAEAAKNEIAQALADNDIDESVIRTYFSQLPERLTELAILIILSALLFFIGVKVIKWIRKIVKRGLKKLGAETGVIQFTDSLINVVLMTILILTIAVNFGVEATSIAAIIGSVSIAIGLALQGALSNFAGGVLILVLKPFKVGDYIKEDGQGNEGVVKEISLFYTKLLTYDKTTIILPNGTLANTSMQNYSHEGTRRIDISCDISYNSDIKKAKKAIYNLMDGYDNVLQDMSKEVFVRELGTSGVKLGIRCHVLEKDYWDTTRALLEDVKYCLDKAKIEIPYSQMDVHIKS